MMLSNEYCIYLTDNIILRRSSIKYIFFPSSLPVAIMLLDVYKIFLHHDASFLFLLSLSSLLSVNSSSIYQRLLMCVSSIAKCYQIRSFDIKRDVACHFYSSPYVKMTTDISSTHITNWFLV